jgi:hypothetical protein
VSQDFCFRFLHESSSPKPLKKALGSYQLFLENSRRKSGCATGINDTDGKFATGVNDNYGNFLTVVDTRGKSATSVNDTSSK